MTSCYVFVISIIIVSIIIIIIIIISKAPKGNGIGATGS